MQSGKLEDYLKTIYLLQEKFGVAKTGALAKRLGITAGSVTEMIKRMSGVSPRLIHYRQHHGVTLSTLGRKKAMSVIRRHRLLETFLHRTLRFGWETVHEEAEVLEHHLSERMVRAIDRHLGSPQFDPHGEPIPDEAGRMAEPKGQQLSCVEPGARFRILWVEPSLDGLLDHLDELGLGLGTAGVVETHAPFGGPVSLRLVGSSRGETATVGKAVADRIYVEIEVQP